MLAMFWVMSTKAAPLKGSNGFSVFMGMRGAIAWGTNGMTTRVVRSSNNRDCTSTMKPVRPRGIG